MQADDRNYESGGNPLTLLSLTGWPTAYVNQSLQDSDVARADRPFGCSDQVRPTSGHIELTASPSRPALDLPAHRSDLLLRVTGALSHNK